MLFLIEYNRQAGVIVYQKTFAEAERQQADDERLRRELALTEGDEVLEIVLLEAQNEAALRITHGRFFGDLGSLDSIAINGG